MNPQTKDTNEKLDHIIRQAKLAVACQNAVTIRREQLNKQHHDIEYDENSKEWRTLAQLTTREIIEIGKIRTELQIIDNLMIKTQHEFKKLGGIVDIEIRGKY